MAPGLMARGRQTACPGGGYSKETPFGVYHRAAG
jgi:hypothetical protein